jgi:helicase MOV-10
MFTQTTVGLDSPLRGTDPPSPVKPEGGYDHAIREEARLDMNDFSRRKEALTIAEMEEESEVLGAQVDRPWRDLE